MVDCAVIVAAEAHFRLRIENDMPPASRSCFPVLWPACRAVSRPPAESGRLTSCKLSVVVVWYRLRPLSTRMNRCGGARWVVGLGGGLPGVMMPSEGVSAGATSKQGSESGGMREAVRALIASVRWWVNVSPRV